MRNQTEDDQIGVQNQNQPLYQPPTPPPYNYNYNSQYYPPTQSRRGLGQVVFWIFYALIGFWLDLSLSVTFWVLSLVLPFTLPFVLAIGGSKGFSQPGFVLVPGDLFYGQSDSLIYTEAGIISVVGIVLLVVAILTLKLWFKFHLTMFRHLGGLKI